MDSLKILSDVIFNTKHTRYLEDLQRRETFDEMVKRNSGMHITKFPALANEINFIYDRFVHTKRLLPSMRSLQFAGEAIFRNNMRMYNCAYRECSSLKVFREAMFILLSGSGFGYSVQSRHVNKLPTMIGPDYSRFRRYLVPDTIEGWADAVWWLIDAYANHKPTPYFDYRDIRVKGSKIKTAGGRAPGSEGLAHAIEQVRGVLNYCVVNHRGVLTPLICHDIFCHISDAVLSGGVRRAAMIALFDRWDYQMMRCKEGIELEYNPQRMRANNSVVLERDIDKGIFDSIWKEVSSSLSGEPAFVWTNNYDYGVNPCAEISIEGPCGVCNLVEINGSKISSQEEFNEVSEAAGFIATLQASYTDFHYVEPIWKEMSEKGALLGVSITGCASVPNHLDKWMAGTFVDKANERVSKLIDINRSERMTCIKPAGTTSLCLGTSSGISAWHSKFYIRRVTIDKKEPVHDYLMEKLPELMEPSKWNKEHSLFCVPIKAPEDSITRDDETTIQLLDRIFEYNREWIGSGHRKGDNKHNVSATVPVKEGEWKEVGEYIWNNRHDYTGISVFPFDGGVYGQDPFEAITEERYDKLIAIFNNPDLHFDLTEVIETEDRTSRQETVACSGGACEIV